MRSITQYVCICMYVLYVHMNVCMYVCVVDLSLSLSLFVCVHMIAALLTSLAPSPIFAVVFVRPCYDDFSRP